MCPAVPCCPVCAANVAYNVAYIMRFVDIVHLVIRFGNLMLTILIIFVLLLCKFVYIY